MTQPVSFPEGKLQKLVDWIDWELTYTIAARAPLGRQWREWLIQYRPPAKNGLKNFPFEGAAAFTIPLTAMDVDPLYAAFMQTLHASDDLWICQALNERWTPTAKPLQDFLTWLDKTLLQMYRVNQRVVLEMVKLGTGIYKTGWSYENRPYRLYDPMGKPMSVQRKVGRPFVDYVSIDDFLLPPSATAVQPDDQGGAPWVAERIRVSPQRLRSLANASAPLLPTIPAELLGRILLYEEAAQTEHREQLQALDYVRRALPQSNINFDRDSGVESSKNPGGTGAHVREIELYEVHARFPTRSDDSEDDLIFWYHRPTRSVLRPIYQPYHHGKRPYEVIRYFPGDGFYGIGVCEQKELFQTMLSDLFNYQHDNVMLSNAGMIAATEGGSIGPNEPWFPGKTILTPGDPRASILPIKMGEVYQSLPQLIQFVLGLGQQRTGVSDLTRGDINALPSRTPASTMQALLAEGKRRPDLTIKDMRYSGLATIGLRVIQLLQQYASDVRDVGGQQYLQLAVQVLGLPEGQLVAEKLVTPMEGAEMGLGVSINAVSGTANKDLERQTMQNLLALHTQVGPQLIQMMQMAAQMQGTPVGQVALEVAQGTAALYTRLLEQHDFRDPEAIVPEIPAPPPPPDQQALGLNGPGLPGDPSLAGLGGLESLLAGAGGAFPGGGGGLAPGLAA